MVSGGGWMLVAASAGWAHCPGWPQPGLASHPPLGTGTAATEDQLPAVGYACLVNINHEPWWQKNTWRSPLSSMFCYVTDSINPNSEGVPATHLSEGGGTLCPPLVNTILMAQTSWNFVCGLTWVVSERFHDQKGTIMCQAPGWVQDPKIQKFQEFWNSDIFFIFFVQNWLPRTQRPFPLNSWWKNGPFWCKNHCSSSKTVDFSIFSGGARKKVGPLGGPLSDMTPNRLVYHFS